MFNHGRNRFPSVAFGYGEGERDDIPIEARQQVLLLNEARADPVTALKDCSDSTCVEKSCYSHPLYPFYWHDKLFTSALLHTNMLAFLDEEKHDLYVGFGHPSPCTLVDSIATTFPVPCDGHADCACVGGQYDKPKNGTEPTNRILKFIPEATFAHQCISGAGRYERYAR